MPSAPVTTERRQACLDHLQAAGRLPSVVAGVLEGGALAWAGGAGDVPGGDVADVQYRIGSITKTFVAVTVLRCAEGGLVSLDDPVKRYLPESGYGAATLRSLLSHTSGMQSEPVGPWWERSPGVDVADLLAVNDGVHAVAGPGEYHHYSNLGFALLGEVVARVRDAGWWDVVRRDLLEPLGMTRTTYHPAAPHADGFSVEHFTGRLTREPHQDTGAMAPAGQAWSTVGDLARWAAFLAAGHPDVLDAAVLREASRAVPPATEYGLGLRLVPSSGRALVGHTGSMPGFLASCFVDPASGNGCVALANATTGMDTDRVPHLLLGTDPVVAAEPWVPTRDLPPTVAGVPGLWYWGNTAFELRWHNERLEMHSLATKARQDVFAVVGERLLGVEGYHRGETLHVVPRVDGTISHLECATFVYTRVPYDPEVDIPGGHP